MEDVASKTDGDEINGDTWKQAPQESQNIIIDSGQALNAGDLRQLAKAVPIVVADKAAANAIAIIEDGRKVFITSKDGGEFTMLTGAPVGTYNDDSNIYAGTRFTSGDGSSGIKRDYTGGVNPVWYGAIGDGVTDDTLAIEGAIIAQKGTNIGGWVEFPAGVFAFSETTPNFGLYIDQPLKFTGAGVEKTTLKNLSATGAGVRAGAGFIEVSDMTIDQNGSSGVAYSVGGQYSLGRDLRIINQTGTSNYTVDADGSTLASLERINISSCIHGVYLGRTQPTNYIKMEQISIQQGAGGVAIKARVSSNIRMDGITIEPADNAAVDHMIELDNCSHIDVMGLTYEDADANSQIQPEYILINNCRSVIFHSGRIVQRSDNAKTIFKSSDTATSGTSINNIFFETDKSGIIFLETVNAQQSVSMRNINIKSTLAYTALLNNNSVTGQVIENINSTSAAGDMTLDATQLMVTNFNGAISVVARNDQAFINCPGAITGTGANAATKINSDTAPVVWTPVLSDGVNNATSNISVGTLVKVGRMVHCKGRLRVASLGSVSGSIRITGLPFVSGTLVNSYASCFFGYADSMALPVGVSITGFMNPGTNYVELHKWSSASGTTPLTASEWTGIGDGMFDITYYVD